MTTLIFSGEMAGASQRDLQWYDHEWEAKQRRSGGLPL